MIENINSTIIAEEKSTHVVETFILEPLVKHPNADSLSVLKITGTDYTYVGRTEDWADKVGKLVCWIPPDSIVDITKPIFSFLAKEGPRVRAKKLRGINSYGVMVLAPEGLEAGDNAAKALGVEHYDPEAAISKNAKLFGMARGEVAPAPKGVFPKYDVDAFMKYGKKVFKEGEMVYVSEKLHGSSQRLVFKDGEMHVGSRTEWKKEFTSPPNITLEQMIKNIGDEEKAKAAYDKAMNSFKPKKSSWWSILDRTPAIREFCEAHPGWAVYGELFGNNKGFRYGAPDGQLLFRAFDILALTEIGPRWLDADDFIETCDKFQVPRVPLLAIMPFDFDNLVAMAEGNTTMEGANHIREGVVVKSQKERWDPAVGRVSLKIINPAYLEKN